MDEVKGHDKSRFLVSSEPAVSAGGLSGGAVLKHIMAVEGLEQLPECLAEVLPLMGVHQTDLPRALEVLMTKTAQGPAKLAQAKGASTRPAFWPR